MMIMPCHHDEKPNNFQFMDSPPPRSIFILLGFMYIQLLIDFTDHAVFQDTHESEKADSQLLNLE